MYVLPFLSELSPLSIYKIEGAAVAGFEPSWVLVVTWINLAPYQNWRCRYNITISTLSVTIKMTTTITTISETQTMKQNVVDKRNNLPTA